MKFAIFSASYTTPILYFFHLTMLPFFFFSYHAPILYFLLLTLLPFFISSPLTLLPIYFFSLISPLPFFTVFHLPYSHPFFLLLPCSQSLIFPLTVLPSFVLFSFYPSPIVMFFLPTLLLLCIFFRPHTPVVTFLFWLKLQV